MIAHGFPPASGSGSFRALAFARYLPMYGWRPLVLTIGNAWAANRDDGLLSGVPRGLRVVRTRSLEPHPAAPDGSRDASGRSHDGSRDGSFVKLAVKSLALRAHVGHLKRFPDAHLGWLPFAVTAAQKLTAERASQFDLIYSSSGPFTSHVVGLVVHWLTGKPWVAELRDGWFAWNRAIFPDYPAWRGLVERRLEATLIRRAQRVVLVTDRMASVFRAQYPDLQPEHFAVVPNGFDPAQVAAGDQHPVLYAAAKQHRAQFAEPERPQPRDMPERQRVPPKSFEVLHAGALYYGRSLSSFLIAARRLIAEDPAFAGAFRLTLLGTLDAAARAEVERAQLNDHVLFRGQLEHAQAQAAMRNAAVLLLVANTTHGAEATVPAKLYEYLAAGRPVLAIAPPDSSTQDVLEQTRGGWLAHADDVDHITCMLRQAFAAHRAGQSLKPDPDAVRRFDRRRLARDLARIFDEACAAPRA
jgi:glycosyltransferase involved in cell wall biosynthesis